MGRYFIYAFLLVSCHQLKAQSPLRMLKDSVKITGVEMVIRNATKDVKSYLFNNENGTTSFKKIGKAIQFSVGTSGFPVAGDSLYSSSDLIKTNVKIWRNGLLQSINAASTDSLTGKVIFRPALIQAERIYIEAFNSIDL
ncbi:hypothetical protein GO495_12020 [Chitinophaga oryziterrae]|uniref:Uncharacterized protein n=1 Tax=Chitinophaga oryziterrae TaxID=1031224 RepID=A0A6N8J880_9BACT|nr:hypothetical protein [Chitinophaga oryziterrae]MVT41313.1 hypothetical protein [Chitinophaga oryziterrae]